MVLRCYYCGTTNFEKVIHGGWHKPRHYCSKECFWMGDHKIFKRLTVFFVIVFLPFFPLWMMILYVSIKGGNLLKESKLHAERTDNLCYYCGKNLGILTSKKPVCMHCGNLVHFCDLCQKYVLYDEVSLQIEPCGHIFHKQELILWFEKEKDCPKCGVSIEFVDFQPD